MQRFNVVFYRIELALALTEIYEGALKNVYKNVYISMLNYTIKVCTYNNYL